MDISIQRHPHFPCLQRVSLCLKNKLGLSLHIMCPPSYSSKFFLHNSLSDYKIFSITCFISEQSGKQHPKYTCMCFSSPLLCLLDFQTIYPYEIMPQIAEKEQRFYLSLKQKRIKHELKVEHHLNDIEYPYCSKNKAALHSTLNTQLIQ